MDDQELQSVRARLERRVKVSDAVWQHLVKDDYPQEVIRARYDGWAAEAEAMRDLVEVATSLNRLAGGSSTRRTPPGRRSAEKTSVDVLVSLNDYEHERRLALSECLAALAALRKDVRDFRRDFLEGERLSPDWARAFFTSPAAGVLRPAQFKEHGITPLTCVATPVAHVGPWPIPLQPSSIHTLATGFVSGLDEDYNKRDVVTLNVDPPSTTVTVVSEPNPETESVWYVDADGRRRSVDEVWQGSLLYDLQQLGAKLDEQYRWPAWAGMWFVLTGATPPVVPFRASGRIVSNDHTYSTITLTIEPWVSADTVLKEYRAIQKKILGRDNRPLSTRNLKILRFVMAQAKEDDTLPPWRDLVDAWNRAYPTDVYKTANLFARDYHRAYQAVVRPLYR